MPFQHFQEAQQVSEVTGCIPMTLVSVVFSGMSGAIVYLARQNLRFTNMLIKRREQEDRNDTRTRRSGG